MVFGEDREDRDGDAAENADGIGAVDGAVVVGAGKIVLGVERGAEGKSEKSGGEAHDGIAAG